MGGVYIKNLKLKKLMSGGYNQPTPPTAQACGGSSPPYVFL